MNIIVSLIQGMIVSLYDTSVMQAIVRTRCTEQEAKWRFQAICIKAQILSHTNTKSQKISSAENCYRILVDFPKW